MEQQDTWGPWIEHDGKGCPCKGQWVQVINKTCGFWEGKAGTEGDGAARSWDWSYSFEYDPVIRYRIRKPRGMVILEALLQDLPQEETTCS